MTDILAEIQCDQRDAQIFNHFKKALPLVIFLSLSIAAAMFTYYRRHEARAQHNMISGDALITTITNAAAGGDQDLAFKELSDLAAKSHNRAKELALITQVQIKLRGQDYVAAKALLTSIVSRPDYSSLTTSYARLIWLSLVIDQKNLPAAEHQQFEQYLQYFSSSQQEFFGMVSMIKALWQIKNGQLELAKNTLVTILSSNLSSDIVKEQAQALMSNQKF